MGVVTGWVGDLVGVASVEDEVLDDHFAVNCFLVAGDVP